MYINEKNLLALNNFDRQPMKKFQGREFALYRSHDPALTATYHGSKGSSCFYEYLAMKYEYGQPQYFIKYPYANVFVELAGGGGAMRGVHERIHLSNPIADLIDPYYYEGELQEETLNLYRFGDRVMLEVKKFSHDFLDRVYHEESQVLSQEYVTIPDIREISYAYYSSRYGKYLIVDQSKYNFQYESMRLFFGNAKVGMQECKITDFARYRDGGTTLFNFEYDGKIYKFNNPTRLSADPKPTILDDTLLEEMALDEKLRFARDLGILLMNKKDPSKQ
jgi:hypothetical protein